MCDYSLEGFKSRKATVGDQLVISKYAHGFMQVATEKRITGLVDDRERVTVQDMCLTCLKPGTKLDVRMGRNVYPNSEFVQLRGVGAYRDHIRLSDGSLVVVASLTAAKVTATVLSIPGATEALEDKLGLDQIRAEVVVTERSARVPSGYQPVRAEGW